MGWECGTYGENGNTYGISVGKSGRNRSLGGPRLKWEHNIKVNLIKIQWEDVRCIYLAQDRDSWRAVVNTVVNIWDP